MAKYGFSPATRVFEAAGAGACIITDYWEGIEYFFTPGEEILVANNADEVIAIINNLSPQRAREIGNAAYQKVIDEHTYNHRAALLQEIFSDAFEVAAKDIV
jgi:spore maturation protein CgeB